jgi:hypothetical protein
MESGDATFPLIAGGRWRYCRHRERGRAKQFPAFRRRYPNNTAPGFTEGGAAAIESFR